MQKFNLVVTQKSPQFSLTVTYSLFILTEQFLPKFNGDSFPAYRMQMLPQPTIFLTIALTRLNFAFVVTYTCDCYSKAQALTYHGPGFQIVKHQFV